MLIIIVVLSVVLLALVNHHRLVVARYDRSLDAWSTALRLVADRAALESPRAPALVLCPKGRPARVKRSAKTARTSSSSTTKTRSIRSR